MKKIILATIISLFFFVSCATYKSLDLGKLTTGMTKAEVESAIGRPDRVLAVNDKKEGYQEVLEYRTSRDEVYALEFWNDYLTGYEFLYDDVNYVASVMPPTIFPPYGRPIYIIHENNRPNRPNRPTYPNRPNPPRPTPTPDRSGLTKPTPGVGPSTSRPSTNRPSTGTRPSTNSRPSYNTNNSGSGSSTTVDRSKLAR
ncbi:hypothetical protein [Prevotella sp. 10(H)]|uniref:hypothetical protein n=1 Tax=Prevotella sp. 10(H) TaxID=1158294 RepID=UPI000691AD39|nr:hypothetical protein [Prevotella sp. 10(H)]